MTSEEAYLFAKSNDFNYHEVSALTGEGVDKVFKEMATDILRKIDQKIIDAKNHPGIKTLTMDLLDFKKGVTEKKKKKKDCKC